MCTLDFDECSLNPCPAGLICVNQDNGYTCSCSEMGCEWDAQNSVEEESDEQDDDIEQIYEIRKI